MAKKRPIESFMPPNILKAKVGGDGRFDQSALKRAEEAVEKLKEEFTGWLIGEVGRLVVAHNTFEGDRSPDNLEVLYRISRDLKGQGSTYDFPLITQLGTSLCLLTADCEDAAAIPMNLIDAHVDAIKVIVRDGIKHASNKTATELAAELERKVSAFAAKRGGQH